MNALSNVVNSGMDPHQIFNQAGQHQSFLMPTAQAFSNTCKEPQVCAVAGNSYSAFPAQWQQVPQTNINWGISNPNSSLVRFTGIVNSEPPLNVPLKRKSFGEESESSPNKILITEEMAAKMHGLHISPNYTAHKSLHRYTGVPRINEIEEDGNNNNNNDDNNNNTNNEDSCSSSYPQLIVCDELQGGIGNKLVPLLPQPLFKVDMPSTALVLWRPPDWNVNAYETTSSQSSSNNSSVMITDITDSYNEAENMMHMPHAEFPNSGDDVMDAMEL